MNNTHFFLGIDIGSTTVKAVVVDARNDTIIWQDYQRHETRQTEKVLEFLKRIDNDIPDVSSHKTQVFVTGSGGRNISRHIGAKMVQEVSAVSLAAEKFHPDVGSVIELGGQDSKIIIFKENPDTEKKVKIPTMNDKCAGGTGAVIDKINAKLRIPSEELCNQGYHDIKIHQVAGKCGVFAETDINSLQKLGVSNDEMMASLFDAIVLQNLTVLTRGNTLRPQVLLLGGPNTFIRGMQEAWRHHIPMIWEERKVDVPPGADLRDLIHVPENALYFAAIGAIEYGKGEEEESLYCGWKELEHYIRIGRIEEKKKAGAMSGLVNSIDELQQFQQQYALEPFIPKTFLPGERVEAFIGLDGGSTSTKAVLMNPEKEVLAKTYILSKGNPIEDSREVLEKLEEQVKSQGAHLEVLGIATTGYAKDVLKEVLGADCAIVETVAHTESALHFYDEVDVICDVGGQDIKIMILKDGKVKDFKLNTQCSAGNGYFLQSTAQDFNIPVEQYAENAFQARVSPEFKFGCAVFLQSDIVNFQRQNWQADEILAGLAAVLPKNIWLYVAQISNFSKLGTKFLLQGGTQRNLAAVKAQVDFIHTRFRGKDEVPEIIVHKHCGESGAIGAALEAIMHWEKGHATSFIGMNAVKQIEYQTTNNELTRCEFCKNKCLRTFIDVNTFLRGEAREKTRIPVQISENGQEKVMKKKQTRRRKNKKPPVPQKPGTRRLIVGNACEKGAVEGVDAMKDIKKEMDAHMVATPNMADIGIDHLFKSYAPANVMDEIPKVALTKKTRRRIKLMQERRRIKIGMPRVQLMYSLAPLFNSYFESLGIQHSNLIYSDMTSDELYREGAKRGAVDPCFPSKLGISHLHNLMYVKHKKRKLNYIFSPMVCDVPPELFNTEGSWICPSVTGTSVLMKAAFTKEEDLFAKHGIQFIDTFINMANRALFEKQMYNDFKDVLGVSKEENSRAISEGFKALRKFRANLRKKSGKILAELERTQQIGIVSLSRPYHKDPGINHGIFEQFQKLGYPIFTQETLPMDEETLEFLFGDEVRAGIISHPLDISDVWKNSMNENANIKLWAAKFTARHPNLVALELSNFKCGHDAPIYSAIEEIIEYSGTPYFSFKDIDENKSAGSIKLRVETIDYFLKQYREELFGEEETLTKPSGQAYVSPQAMQSDPNS